MALSADGSASYFCPVNTVIPFILILAALPHNREGGIYYLNLMVEVGI
jgi:hypothetical protein